MTEETMNNDNTQTEDLRTETAEAAPELAEHDGLKAELEEAKQQALYVQAEMQSCAPTTR
jgi:molecular chaperone GrpE